MKRFLLHNGGRRLHPRDPNRHIRQRFIHVTTVRRQCKSLFSSYNFSSPRVCWGSFLLLRAFSQNPEKDYYKILGVSTDASQAQVKSAFYNLAKRWHPDLFHGKPESELNEARVKFREIQEAHEVLSDKVKREQYDMYRKYGSTGRTTGGSGFGPGYSQGFNRGYNWQQQANQSQSSKQSQEDFWKRQQEMYERMEEMRKQNPEMFKQQEQIRLVLYRLWMGLLIFIVVRIIFGLFRGDDVNPDQFIRRSGLPHEHEEADQRYDSRYRDSRFGERPLGARRFNTPEQQTWREKPPSFGNTNYPKKIYILGDELPSMYLSPATEMQNERPSYRSSRPIAGTGLYFILYHGEGEWRICLSQYINQGSKSYAKVQDSAYNPTEISSSWSVFDRRYNRYEFDSNFRVSAVPEETGDGQWA